MRAAFIFLLLGLSVCITEGLLASEALKVEGTPFSVSIRQLPETKKGEFPSEIRLMKNSKVLSKFLHRADPTGGYASNLSLNFQTSRFVAVSFDAGEFCNALVLFDLQKQKVAGHLGCVSNSHRCRVKEIDSTKRCTATIDCRDESSDEGAATKAPITKKLLLCE